MLCHGKLSVKLKAKKYRTWLYRFFYIVNKFATSKF